MDRLALVPATHRAERLFLLDVLAGKTPPFDVDAEAFLAVAPKKLHPFLFVRLREAQLPAAVRDVLSAAYRRNALQELRRAAELRRIDGALAGAGIGFLVLKGPVLAATVYPDRAARTMTDLDFLIAGEEMDRAMRVLEQAGYRVPPQFAGAELAAGDAPPLIHDEPGGPSVELHAMLDSLPDERAAFAAMRPSARRVDVGHGLVVPALERGELFAHVAAHVSRHHRFEGELRSLLDIALLLRHEELDWDTRLAEWDRRGIADWIVLTATLAHILLDAPLPRAFADRGAPEEALAIAAEQLWITAKSTVPPTVTFAIGGGAPKPMHTHVPGTTAAMPGGMDGVRVRATRSLERLRRVLSATVRPRAIASEVEMHRKRERLYAIVEKPARRTPT